MALKPDRHEFNTDISFFMNEVAERGGVVTIATAGSGAAMDQAAALVSYSVNPSGKQPVGILLNDMVNVDLTRYKLNEHKNEMQKGSKVTVLKQGWVTTNYIRPGDTPAASDAAYCAESGYISCNAHGNASNPEARPLIGRFLSKKDDEGYAKVEINVPQPMVRGK